MGSSSILLFTIVMIYILEKGENIQKNEHLKVCGEKGYR